MTSWAMSARPYLWGYLSSRASAQENGTGEFRNVRGEANPERSSTLILASAAEAGGIMRRSTPPTLSLLLLLLLLLLRLLILPASV